MKDETTKHQNTEEYQKQNWITEEGRSRIKLPEARNRIVEESRGLEYQKQITRIWCCQITIPKAKKSENPKKATKYQKQEPENRGKTPKYLKEGF